MEFSNSSSGVNTLNKYSCDTVPTNKFSFEKNINLLKFAKNLASCHYGDFSKTHPKKYLKKYLLLYSSHYKEIFSICDNLQAQPLNNRIRTKSVSVFLLCETVLTLFAGLYRWNLSITLDLMKRK